MNERLEIIQDPAPGSRLLRFRGDTLTFTLTLKHPAEGSAWLRSNIGHANVTRAEIIREVDADERPLGSDWYDVEMHRMDKRTFRKTVPLDEVGHFDSKCYFLSKDAHFPCWPQGFNTVVNVEPADTCCFNTIYNAFVRQFGPNKSGKSGTSTSERNLIQALDRKGYAVIPPSGKFRDLIQELDFIMGELGCRFIQLLPVHPTPTTYGRMGRFGSPFAALSFKTVDPALALFDPKATPMEQFVELVDAVHARSGRLILDFAVNHTGWAARLHDTHPQWLARDPEGKIEVPGAWGVQWEDLTKLDFSKKKLWQFMAEVFLLWCKRGVDGFRCDAGYMIPLDAWKYMIARVREQYPETIFFLEGLGGKISVTRDLLNRGNFNWAYSELFQNYDRSQIESYLPEMLDISKTEGILVNFSETHDNNRLAARSHAFARMRTALCALSSPNGAFGFANGVEWYAAEKIDVHDAPSLNWGAQVNQVKEIRRLTSLLRSHPAFFDRTEIRMIQAGPGNQIVLLRLHRPSGKRLLILANLNDALGVTAGWDVVQSGIDRRVFFDLLTDERVDIRFDGSRATCALAPGQVRCLSADPEDIRLFDTDAGGCFFLPERIEHQRKRAKVLEVLRHYPESGVDDLDLDRTAVEFGEDPCRFFSGASPPDSEPRLIQWEWPQDTERVVMVPPGYFLMLRSPSPFYADLMDGGRAIAREGSIRRSDGTYFAVFSPLPVPEGFRSLTLNLSVFLPGENRRRRSTILYLPKAESVFVQRAYPRSSFNRNRLLFLATNGRGAMCRAAVSWGRLYSRYDALLAGNLHPDIPEDRWIMLARCRAWVVFQDYSQELCDSCLERFCLDKGSEGAWHFQVPTGQGGHVRLSIGLSMIPGKNEVRLIFYRHPSGGIDGRVADDKPLRLIVRPDVENRNFHHVTKAFTGPEHHFSSAIERRSDGFTFTPDPHHRLRVVISEGRFVWEPEWHYMVHRPVEAERGLDPNSDLFSPGYFDAQMRGGEAVELSAEIGGDSLNALSCAEKGRRKKMARSREDRQTKVSLSSALSSALTDYVVRRGDYKSIVAGYPWFLDWGRDALIVVRGLIADARLEEAHAVLRQFGRFEDRGTLPNMIHGEAAGNRDTSDAPLWFIVACRDLAGRKEESFLNEKCAGRSIREILLDIGNHYRSGTPNGIRMDPESGLIYSPMHFSWMDTNFPAGTPRQGYPIEIQALWHAAVDFLSRIDPAAKWKEIAVRVRASILDSYLLDRAYLSDCLHSRSGESAAKAEPDDALRPNQLFAVTMGAVTEKNVCRRVVSACQELLVPGAIRTLADRPVRRPFPIHHQGSLLNDPHRPYRGRYEGDEDTSRKPAYHNGTAWTWVFPSFCEAWVIAYGASAKATARSWLASCAPLLMHGCVGHVPEILDGNAPHSQRGCDAQAWGASEFLRVWKLLEE